MHLSIWPQFIFFTALSSHRSSELRFETSAPGGRTQTSTISGHRLMLEFTEVIPTNSYLIDSTHCITTRVGRTSANLLPLVSSSTKPVNELVEFLFVFLLFGGGISPCESALFTSDSESFKVYYLKSSCNDVSLFHLPTHFPLSSNILIMKTRVYIILNSLTREISHGT